MRWILPTCICLLVFAGCRREQSQVPLVTVDIVLNLNEPQFFDLTVPTGWAYITGGSRGIIVYRNSIDTFTAIERHSPYDVPSGCAVVVTDDNVIIDDPCSDSQWLIVDGSIVSGPTDQPLKVYQTQFSDPFLSIFN